MTRRKSQEPEPRLCCEISELLARCQGANKHLEIAKREILKTHSPDGFNIGINIGAAAGQTVPHLHLHLIPRYQGDVSDPRGGIRHVIPGKGNYLAGPTEDTSGN